MSKRQCPECAGSNYEFRGRKKIPADPGTQLAESTETKFRCKECRHEWRERVHH
jgi:hypothetical protein